MQAALLALSPITTSSPDQLLSFTIGSAAYCCNLRTNQIITIQRPVPIFIAGAAADEGADEEGLDNNDSSAGEDDNDESDNNNNNESKQQQQQQSQSKSKKSKLLTNPTQSHPALLVPLTHNRIPVPKPALTVMNFDSTGEYLMIGGDDKQIHCYSTIELISNNKSANNSTNTADNNNNNNNSKSVIGLVSSCSFSKKPCYSILNRMNNSYYVADLVGDIWELPIETQLKPQKLIAAHLANITGLELLISNTDNNNNGKSYLFSSDSDGKVRISNYPNQYSIESFCLGYREFVSTMCIVNDSNHSNNNYLITGSFGNKFLLWNYLKGEIIDSYTIDTPIDSNSNTANTSNNTNYKYFLSHSIYSSINQMLAIVLYPLTNIYLFTINNGKLVYHSTIAHSNIISTIIFDSIGRLILIDQLPSIHVYSISNNNNNNTTNNSPIIDYSLLFNKLNTEIFEQYKSTAATVTVTDESNLSNLGRLYTRFQQQLKRESDAAARSEQYKQKQLLLAEEKQKRMAIHNAAMEAKKYARIQ